MAKSSKAITTTDSSLAALGPEQLLARIPAMLEQIPDVSDDPTPRMAAAILAADDPSDWEAIFKGRSIKDSAGARVRIMALRKLPSSYEGLVKSYLVAEIVHIDTGESDVLSISSTMSILQLLVAHERGWLPLDVEVVRKDKPTRRGFHPIHLKALEPAKRVGAAG